jgi:hypothetical protein
MTTPSGEAPGDLQPFPRGADQPVVFMFQPTHFRVMQSDEFSEWERLLAQGVGLQLDEDSARRLVKTICVCSGNDDDCDVAEYQSPTFP